MIFQSNNICILIFFFADNFFIIYTYHHVCILYSFFFFTKVPQLIRPEPLQDTTQKFHLNVRQYYVNLMQDICVQIYTNGDDAAQRALREELACHERCKALSVYKNSCMLAAHRLRKEVDPSNSDNNSVGPSASGMVSHDAVLAGRGKGTWSVVKTKKAITNFKGSAFYSMLKKWIMTEQQLKDWGFPLLHPDGPKVINFLIQL